MKKNLLIGGLLAAGFVYTLTRGGSIMETVSRGKFINDLKAQKGKPYRLGYDGPNAFDCASLPQYCYRLQGINIPDCVTEQVQSAPNKTVFDSAKTIDEVLPYAKPGDCLAMDYEFGGRYSHVIVYIGNGKVIQATGDGSCPNPSKRCKVVEDSVTRFTGRNFRAVYNYFPKPAPKQT